MKKFLFILLIFIAQFSQAQIFTSTGGSIKNDSTVTTLNLPVTATPTMTTSFGLIRVKINIIHPAVQELHIYLKSPNGNSIALSISNGNGSNYNNTIFDNTASVSIRDASAPFNGTFKPENSLAVYNTNNTPANGTWSLNILDDLKNGNSGNCTLFSLEFGNGAAQPTPLTQTNLPVFVVTTGGKAIPTINDINAKMFILDDASGINKLSDTQKIKSLPIGIHIRGNSSTSGLKDPYSFSPKDIFGNDSNMVMLGMPSENDWILNNSYSDQSFMRDRISYYLSNRMGRYATRTRYCELVIDGDYRGLYILMENIKQDKHRVNISNLKITDTSGTDVTGGYIIKKDGAPGLKDSGFMHTPSGYYYLYQDPDSPAIQQKKYIKAFIDTAVNAVLTLPLNDTLIGYRKYIDYKSVIDYIIGCEIGVSGDTYNRSTYWYKDKITKNNKLFFGPVWDFNYGWLSATTVFRFPSFTPWKRIYSDTFFRRELWCRYNDLRATFLNSKTINSVMDSMINPIYDAIYRNDERWFENKSGGLLISNCYYKDAIYFLKKYTFERLAFMDNFMRDSCRIDRISCSPIFSYDVYNACSADSAVVLVNTTAVNVELIPSNGVRKVNNYKFMISPSAAGVLKLRWSACNFIDSTIINVTSNNKPIINCYGKDTMVTGDSILLVASGAKNYYWSPAVNYSNANGDSVYVKPTINTTYTVTGSLGLGCSGFTTKNITVLSAHPITLYASADSLCAGSMLKLKATGAEQYVWDINGLLNMSDSITLYPTTDLVIKLSGLYGGSLTDFKTKFIKVFTPKQLNVIPKTPLYFGASPVMIVVQGAKSYSWSPSTGLNRTDNDTVYASPSASTLYTVNAIDSNNCATSTTIYVANKVGIRSNNSISSINAYPNPFADAFKVTNSTNNNITISIFNALGQLMLTTEIKAGNNIIKTKSWAPGIYFMKSDFGTVKLVKQD